MAKLTFTIPDARMPEVVEAWSQGWTAEIPNPDVPGEMIPNPVTQQQFANDQIKQSIVGHVKWFQGQAIETIPIV